MNVKQLAKVRKSLVERFGMPVNAPTTEVVKRLIDEERLFADYPSDVSGARAFLRTYESIKAFRKIKPIPEGWTRKDVGL